MESWSSALFFVDSWLPFSKSGGGGRKERKDLGEEEDEALQPKCGSVEGVEISTLIRKLGLETGVVTCRGRSAVDRIEAAPHQPGRRVDPFSTYRRPHLFLYLDLYVYLYVSTSLHLQRYLT